MASGDHPTSASRRLLLGAVLLTLQACSVFSAAGTAVGTAASVAGAAISTSVSVAGTAASTTASVVGSAVRTAAEVASSGKSDAPAEAAKR